MFFAVRLLAIAQATTSVAKFVSQNSGPVLVTQKCPHGACAVHRLVALLYNMELRGKYPEIFKTKW